MRATITQIHQSGASPRVWDFLPPYPQSSRSQGLCPTLPWVVFKGLGPDDPAEHPSVPLGHRRGAHCPRGTSLLEHPPFPEPPCRASALVATPVFIWTQVLRADLSSSSVFSTPNVHQWADVGPTGQDMSIYSGMPCSSEKENETQIPTAAHENPKCILLELKNLRCRKAQAAQFSLCEVQE